MKTRNHNIFSQTFYNSALESAFRQDVYMSSLILVRWSLFGSIFLHALFLYLDAVILNDYERFQLIRLFVLIPSSFVIFLASYIRKFKASVHYLYAIVIIINSSFMAIGLLIYGEQTLMYWSSGTVIVVIFSAMLMGLRFIFALSVIWLSVIMQAIAIYYVGAGQVQSMTAFVLITVCGFLLSIGSFVFERTNRESFLRSRQLIEYEKLRKEDEQSRLEWLEQIASFLRHELRNAMNGARTSLELINRSGEVDQSKIYIERGNKSIQNMSELLNSVSDATSLESSFYNEKAQRINLNEMLRRYFNTCCDAYSNIELENNFEPTDIQCEIMGREERISQMLDKIIDNALDYCAEDSAIKVRCCYGREKIIIEIENQGPALPANKKIIFDLFSSFRENIQPGKKRGYGLYIARLIAEHYKGTVEAYDLASDVGARFVICLPTIN